MEKIKYIRGVKGRGTEIRKLLVKSGAVNDSDWENCHFELPEWLFFIDKDNDILAQNSKNTLGMLLMEHGEELFLEPQYKYKVGDKVMLRKELNTATCCTVRELINDKGKPYYELTGDGFVGLFSEEDITPYVKQVKAWKDLIGNEIKGYYIEVATSEIKKTQNALCIAQDKSIAASEKVAKAMLAMAQISQLMPYYGGEITEEEWDDGLMLKYSLVRYDNNVRRNTAQWGYEFLSFHTEEQRQEFLENNWKLVCNFLMLPENVPYEL